MWTLAASRMSPMVAPPAATGPTARSLMKTCIELLLLPGWGAREQRHHAIRLERERPVECRRLCGERRDVVALEVLLAEFEHWGEHRRIRMSAAVLDERPIEQLELPPET